MPAELYRFCLKQSSVCVARDPDGKATAVVVPTGAEVTTADLALIDSSPDRLNLMIQIQWRDRTLSMFLTDLLARGERVESDRNEEHASVAQKG
ncbi:MAG TPA: hypothetical protein VMB03_19495 [Bryobacteraceae bacterium]|nr:hypothetical protein [Bryobacteraceae bacterium]